ncbi:MAG: porin [Gammaproteobacteria bacterium]|jgi:FtsZ-binding cell division protein ZapB|nr:porin [Gammaproteobacteria bacterium]|tara:strand:+ start:194 stop:1402 length:1209 start_codon:yes stop_codon:yes gene_type:complete
MKKLVLAGLLAITPVTFAETLEHVEEEVHLAMETIQQLKAELNELKAAVKMQGEVQEASMGKIAKAAKKFEKIHIGGYGELHYNDHETDGGSKSKKVDAHRYVLFFGYDYNEKVRFRSEFELEHGLVKDTADGSNGGEVELEQMYIEIDLNDQTSTKAGVILVPVGIMNENHEPPTFYGVERNDVEKYLIPATWWAAGVSITHKMSNGITLEAMVSEGLKGTTAGYIRGGRQKSADATASDLAYTARLTYTGMPGLKASLFYNHQSDFTQDSSDNIEEMDLYGATAIYNFGDGFEVRALHVQADFSGKDESGAFFTNGFDEHQGTFFEVSKRTGNLGIYANQSIVSGEKVSRQYTVQTAGFSFWPQGTNTVFKINYYDKDYSSESLNSSDTDGFDIGMGYEF